MTEPIVYLTMPVSAPPAKDGEYFVITNGGINGSESHGRREWRNQSGWQRIGTETILNWLQPSTLSTLLEEKQKQIDAQWIIKVRDLAKTSTELLNKKDAEIAALKAQLLQVAEDTWDEAESKGRSSILYIKGEVPYKEHAKKFDKSTYINNLKKELNIQS